MISILKKKLYQILILLPSVIILSFVLLSFSPLDPVKSYVSNDIMRIGEEQKEKIAEKWGFNDPLYKKVLLWAGQIIKGDPGTSLVYNAPVKEVIREKFFTSLWLMFVAWTISGVLGFLFGVLSGLFRGSLFDKIMTTYAYILSSAPLFWVGILVLMVFSFQLNWLPFCGAGPPGVLPENITIVERIRHLILPALVLSITGTSNIILHTRKKFIEIMQSDFVLFAKARGEKTGGIVIIHGLRNIILPAITLQFASLGEIFGGSVLVEKVFSYPGLGQAAVKAGLMSDTPLLLGIVIFSALFVFTGNTIADILYIIIDPRIKSRHYNEKR